MYFLDALDPGPGGGRRDAAVQVEGGGAVLGRPGEERDPVQPGRLQERLQLAHVGLALAGEAEDEVGAEGGVRVEGADPGHQVEEGAGRAAAAHPPQHGRAGVLQREVEVAADHRVGGHLLEQAGGELVGLEVVEAHPAQAVDPGQVAEQVDQGLAAAQVLAVAGGVLGDQADLGDALAGQPGHLVEDLGGTPGAEPAPERRDGAERAVPVAALGQLDQGHRPPGGRPGRERRPRRGREHHRQRPPPRRDEGGGGVRPEGTDGSGRWVRIPSQQGRELAVVPKRDDGVGLGELDPQLLGVALGQAAGDQDRAGPALVLQGGRVQDGLDRLALGRLHERAGVDDHGVGLLGVGHDPVPGGGQQPGGVLGVDLVAPAPQGDDRHRRRRLGVGLGHRRALLVAVNAATTLPAAAGIGRVGPRRRGSGGTRPWPFRGREGVWKTGRTSSPASATLPHRGTRRRRVGVRRAGPATARDPPQPGSRRTAGMRDGQR